MQHALALFWGQPMQCITTITMNLQHDLMYIGKISFVTNAGSIDIFLMVPNLHTIEHTIFSHFLPNCITGANIFELCAY